MVIVGPLQNGDPGNAATGAVSTYNPAALLNPRAFNGTAVLNDGIQNNFFNGPGTITRTEFTPLEFSFDGANTNCSEPATSNTAHTPNQSNGYGDMIERMNNVEHRTLAPSQNKRRKLETENGFGSKPAFSAGESSILSQHIKEGGQESKQAANTRVEMVDLTSGSASFSSKRHELVG